MVPIDDAFLEIAWDDDFVVECVNNDVAKTFCTDSTFVARASDVALDLVIAILF